MTETQKRFDRLVELNVREQWINIIKIDHAHRDCYKTGCPKIHGWVYDVKIRKLIDSKLTMEEEFKKVRSIYDFKPTK